jgi:hypothetical protein
VRLKPKTLDFEWDSCRPERADSLFDAKRALENFDAQRVGWEPDWKLRLVMLREQREQEVCDRRSEMANRPEIRALRSRAMKVAWEAGRFSSRADRTCPKRTPERVQCARQMRAAGHTYAEIAQRLAVTQYTVMKWLGWTRPAEPTNRTRVEVNGVEYPSLREAERRTGMSRWVLAHRLQKARV